MGREGKMEEEKPSVKKASKKKTEGQISAARRKAGKRTNKAGGAMWTRAFFHPVVTRGPVA